MEIMKPADAMETSQPKKAKKANAASERYCCVICSCAFPERVAFWTHIKSHHGMSRPRQANEIPGPLTLVSSFECNICRTEILLEMSSVEAHLWDRHPGTDTGDYFKRHNMEPPPMPEISDVFSLTVNEGDKENKPGPLSSAGKAAAAADNPAKNKVKTKAAATKAAESEVPVTLEAEKWYEGCVYRCTHCGLEKFSREHMSAHAKKAHGYRVSAMTESCAHYRLVRTEYVDCRECDEALLRDYLVIKGHVRTRHKMGMTDYAAKHYANK